MLTIKKVTLPLAATVLCYTITAGSAFAAKLVFVGQEDAPEDNRFTIYKYELQYNALEVSQLFNRLTFTTPVDDAQFGLLAAEEEFLNTAQGYNAVGNWETSILKLPDGQKGSGVQWTRNMRNNIDQRGTHWRYFVIKVEKAKIKADPDPKGLKWKLKEIATHSGEVSGPVPLPEPFTILGTGFAAAALPVLKRANKKAKK